MRPQSHPKATPKPPQSHLRARIWPGDWEVIPWASAGVQWEFRRSRLVLPGQPRWHHGVSTEPVPSFDIAGSMAIQITSPRFSLRFHPRRIYHSAKPITISFPSYEKSLLVSLQLLPRHPARNSSGVTHLLSALIRPTKTNAFPAVNAFVRLLPSGCGLGRGQRFERRCRR